MTLQATHSSRRCLNGMRDQACFDVHSHIRSPLAGAPTCSYIILAEYLFIRAWPSSLPAFIAYSVVLLCRSFHHSGTCPSSLDHPRSLPPLLQFISERRISSLQQFILEAHGLILTSLAFFAFFSASFFSFSASFRAFSRKSL